MRELEKDILSGLYCYKELYRRHPDIPPTTVKNRCRSLGLKFYQAKVREEFYEEHRKAVRDAWSENLSDKETSNKTGLTLSEVKAIRVRFGFIGHSAENTESRKIEITKLYEDGLSDADIACELGESESAIRSFRMRHGINTPRNKREYYAPTMNKLKPLFIEHYTEKDSFISKLSGYSKNTVLKYRRIFLRQLIEKEKAAS